MATDPTTDDLEKAAAAFAHVRNLADAEATLTEAEQAMLDQLNAPNPQIQSMLDRMDALRDTKAPVAPMQSVIERLLDAAAADLPPGHMATIEAHVWFKDKSGFSGAIRRAEEPGMYIVGAGEADQRTKEPTGFLIEVYFHASDATRVALRRKIDLPKIVLVGDKKIFVPQG